MSAEKQVSSQVIDALCDRFEAEHKAGGQPLVEDFLAEAPSECRTALLRELLFIDYEYRARAGDPPLVGEYQSRFPQQTALIERVVHRGDNTLAGQGERTIHPDGGQNANDARDSDDGRNLETISSAASDRPPSADAQATLSDVQLAEEDATNLPQLLGDYQLMEEIGRGGMGIVYRARQLSVGRVVALKVLRRDKLQQLSPAARETMIERFRTESQSAAHLDHDHIVPVYEVGEAAGQHYYSMRFVEGKSLGDLIGEHPLENRRAAELIAPVARALHETHREGILHRDIKPRNIIVDSKSGRPMLADFGLAKLMETDREMTHTGDVMGSPPYMSPEQAIDAARVTPAADVYSLGATLYHLLVGRPPFQAATVAETLRQVWYDEPAPPRRVNPAIDRDLETIALKCLEKEPARRFATAGELADELQRFLDGQPIKSRPIGHFGRLSRWCRRNPAVATLLSAVAVLLVVVTVVSVIGYVQTAASLKREKASSALAVRKAQEAQQNLKLAEENLHLAQDAVERFSDLAIEDPRLRSHGLDSLRRDFLTATREYFDKFVQQSQGDPQLKAMRGKAYARLAGIEADLGHREKAIELYAQAVEIYEGLSDKQIDGTQRQYRIALYQRHMADLWRELGRRQQAEKTLQSVFSVAQQLSDKHAGEVNYKALLADTHNGWAALHKELQRPEQAEKSWRTAIEIWTWITEQNQIAPDYFNELAKCHNNLAVIYRESDRLDEAKTQYADAMKIWQRLASEHAEVSDYTHGLATCQYNLGILHLKAGEHQSARPLLLGALVLRHQLADKHPDLPEYQSELATCHDGLGQLYQDMARTQQRDEHFQMAYDEFYSSLLIREKLRNQHDDVPEYNLKLAASQINVGNLYQQQGRYAQAQSRFRVAIDILGDLVTQYPDVSSYRVHQAGANYDLGLSLQFASKAEDAIEPFSKAIQSLWSIVESGTDRAAARLLQTSLVGRAHLYDELEKHDLALADWNQIVQLTGESQRPLATLWRAVSLARSGDHREAANAASAVLDHGQIQPVLLYQGARVLSRAAEAALKDMQLDESQRMQLAGDYLDKGALLIQALDRIGYFEAKSHQEKLRSDPDMSNVRSHENVLAILEKTRGEDSPDAPVVVPETENDGDPPAEANAADEN